MASISGHKCSDLQSTSPKFSRLRRAKNPRATRAGQLDYPPSIEHPRHLPRGRRLPGTQTDTPARRVHAEKARDIDQTSRVESQIVSCMDIISHMSRGSYDPMNCTASCFVVGPHLMMVLETFPLHLFPLGLTTTEKVRPALSRVLVILRLARRACLSCGSEASVPACASALARVSACARALSTTWRSEAKSRLVCLAQAVLGRDCSERLYPLPVRTILDRCQVGVRLALSQLLLFGHNRACPQPGYSFVWLSTRPIPDYRKL